MATVARKIYANSFEGVREYVGDWLGPIYEQNKLILKRIAEMSAQTDALKTAFDNLSTKVSALIQKNTDQAAVIASHATDDAAVQSVTDGINTLADSIPS